MTDQQLKIELDKIEHELKQLRKLASLLQNAWFYCEFKAETLNESEMESIMRKQGYWPITMNAETLEPNLNQYLSEVKAGNTSNTLDLIDEHMVIRETVGYDFLNKVDVVDIPEVIKFLKVVFNYTKMDNLNKQ